MPFSQSQRSRSKPWGLLLPCGWRRRTVRRQRSPARQAGPAPTAPRLYQPSCSKAGRRRAWPSRDADSSANSKRTPSAPRCGSEATRPVTSMSMPSSAGGSAWAAKCTARTPVRPAPARAPAHKAMAMAHRPFPRRPTPSARPPSRAQPSSPSAYTHMGHSTACCSCSATPSTQPGKAASAIQAMFRPDKLAGHPPRVHTSMARDLLAHA